MTQWQLTKDAPIVKFLDKLATTYTQIVRLHALRQTQQAMLQLKSLQYSERTERGNRLEQSGPARDP
jgi:hypothetical protein